MKSKTPTPQQAAIVVRIHARKYYGVRIYEPCQTGTWIPVGLVRHGGRQPGDPTGIEDCKAMARAINRDLGWTRGRSVPVGKLGQRKAVLA